MMLFDKSRRPALAVLGIALLAGLLPLGGCSDSAATSTTRGSGDKRDDPALKSSMEKSKERFKPQTQAPKGNPGGGKSRP